jgi:hypothetical protein
MCPDTLTVAESARAGNPSPESLSTLAVMRVAVRAVAQTRKSGASWPGVRFVHRSRQIEPGGPLDASRSAADQSS